MLCAEYKIVSKCLSNRLKEYLGLLVHKDQSYCVPDHSIVDNLFLIRYVLDMCKLSDVNVGLLSLDQEKAFDRVDHQYLFKTKKAFGFGDDFFVLDEFTVCCGLMYGDGGGWFELPHPCPKGHQAGMPNFRAVI